MHDERLDPALNEFEARLATLRPAESRLVRDELMYQAGIRATSSAGTRGWLWPLATAAMTAVSVTLGVVVLTASGTDVTQRENAPPRRHAVEKDRQPAVPTVARSHPNNLSDEATRKNLDQPYSYMRLRHLVLTKGVDAMPLSAPIAAGESNAHPTSNRRALKSFLES
jgi:hypothetical protein